MLLRLMQGEHGFSSISGLLNCEKLLKFFKRVNVGGVDSKFSLKFGDMWNRRCV